MEDKIIVSSRGLEVPHLPAVLLPFTVGGTDGAKDLMGLYADTVKRLLAALGNG